MSEAMTIADYVREHTTRGECKCGQCIDAGGKPDPTGHTADLIFFKVAAKGDPDKDTFIHLAQAHKGEYGDCDVFDGKEHGYMELGGWIGDQGLAMQFMGLGTILGAFKLLTPRMLFGNDPANDGIVMQMAGQGMVTIVAVKSPALVPA